MKYTKELNIASGKAICYSGFREGQSPGGVFPSYKEIKEDLLILQNHWKYLRLYDCDKHSEIVLEVIEKEKLNFKVMLGAYIVAEANNYGCPWGGSYSEKQLEKNKITNVIKIKNLIVWPTNILTSYSLYLQEMRLALIGRITMSPLKV